MGGVQRSHAAVAKARRRAQDPGARAGDHRVPPEPPRRRIQCADHADRLVLAPVRGAGRDVAGDQPQAAQPLEIAR
jgi:hypothetical protein